MPAGYFNATDKTGYYAAGSPELSQHGNNAYGAHRPVSFGVHDGKTTGPNLAGYAPRAPHSTALQTGGRVGMPAGYFNATDKTGYYAEGSAELSNHGNNAYGAHRAVSFGVHDGKTAGPNLAGYAPRAPHSTALQTGGEDPYSMIVNPETGRRVSIYGKTGQRVLRKYSGEMKGGGRNKKGVVNLKGNLKGKRGGDWPGYPKLTTCRKCGAGNACTRPGTAMGEPVYHCTQCDAYWCNKYSTSY